MYVGRAVKTWSQVFREEKCAIFPEVGMGETTTPEIIVDNEPDIVVEDEDHAEEAQDSLSVPDDSDDRGWVFFFSFCGGLWNFNRRNYQFFKNFMYCIFLFGCEFLSITIIIEWLIVSTKLILNKY